MENTKVKFEGVVKWFDLDRGYGFVKSVKPIGDFLCNQIAEQFSIDDAEMDQFIDQRERAEDDLFCHSNSIIEGNEEPIPGHYQDSKYKKLKENDKVEFFIKLVKGREQACYVILV
ncbi:cold shock domain-containing protein ['Camptotheca acuminata' phytoplasma]|uniref:cold shock domain-containing protein n=1 Tax='Camptotheca acuminata' phytoplasma TaxID=3239192 RepID=UPI00351A3277